MDYSTLLLAKFQTDNLESKIWIISTIELQHHASVYVQEIIQREENSRPWDCCPFTSTKRVVSVKDLLCTFSDIEKDQQETIFI